MRKCVALALVAVGSTAFSLRVEAAVGDCRRNPIGAQVSLPEVREWRVNSATCDDLPGITCDEFITTAIAAANVWNETSRGEMFRYKGTTTENVPDCLTTKRNIVTVIQRDVQAASSAGISFFCIKSGSTDREAFRIFVAQESGFDTIPWGVGNIATTELDLFGALVHEFGHTLEIDHPTAASLSDDAGAAMRPTVGVGIGFANWDFGSTQARDLYLYDLKCAPLWEPRSLSVAATFGTSSTGVSTTFTSSTPGATATLASAAAGISATSGPAFSVAMQTQANATVIHDISNPASTTLTALTQLNGGTFGYNPLLFREQSSSPPRVVYVDDNELPTDFGLVSSHTLRVATANYGGSTLAQFCGVASSSCSVIQTVKSGKPIGAGFVGGGVNKSVFVWANQTRDESSADREILASVGFAGGDIFQQPDALGIRTNAPPAVACRETAAECVIAYADTASSSHWLYTRKLTVQFSSTKGRHEVIKGSPTVITDGTNSRIAVWHDGSHYWLAFKPLFSGEKVMVYKSISGTSWTLVQSAFLETPTGVSAASVWRGTTNALTTAK